MAGLEQEWTDENEDPPLDENEATPPKRRKTGKKCASKSKKPTRNHLKPKNKLAQQPQNAAVVDLGDENSAFGDLADLEEALESVATDYFGGRKEATKKKKTEKERVEVPLEALRDWLQEADSHLDPRVELHHQQYSHLFPKWRCELSHGFNVILYGFGSKLGLLNEFCEDVLKKEGHTFLVINGFNPSLDLKAVFLAIFEMLDIAVLCSPTVPKMAEYLVESYSRTELHEFTMVIHNMDGTSLRNSHTQTALAMIAHIERVHMIVSIDHPNLPLLWDDNLRRMFNWVWHQCTTFLCYKTELTSGESKLLGLCGGNVLNSHTVASLESVWASLTKNARLIFIIIVQETFKILAASKKQKIAGVDFWKIYKEAHSEFLVSNETNFERQLVEFIDHRLILRKMVDSVDTLTLFVEPRIVNNFMREQGIELPDVFQDNIDREIDEILDE